MNMSWQVTVTDLDDPERYRAVAIQTGESTWDVKYFRGGEEISYGSIGTPAPHLPPFTTLQLTIQQLRLEHLAAESREGTRLHRDERRP